MAACASGLEVAQVESGHWEPILSALWRSENVREQDALSTDFILSAAHSLTRILGQALLKRSESEWAYHETIANALK